MSDEVDDLRARLLLMDHNRRAKLLSTAMPRTRQWRFSWTEALYTIGLLGLLVWLVHATSWREGLFACVLVTLVTGIIGEQFAMTDKRIDALIELLQQDGMLQSRLPASYYSGDEKAATKP